jgi:hypothetical protein
MDTSVTNSTNGISPAMCERDFVDGPPGHGGSLALAAWVRSAALFGCPFIKQAVWQASPSPPPPLRHNLPR